MKLRMGSYYRFDGTPLAATRFGFSTYSPEELQQAVALLA
jgi:hypothetical protein